MRGFSVIGVLSLMTVLLSSIARAADLTKFIMATEVDWNYSPLGYNGCSGANYTSPATLFTVEGIGGTLKKAQFLEYTDDSFSTPIERPQEEQHLGILGPLLHLSPGDTITIHLYNKLDFSINLEPSGLIIEPSDSSNAVFELPVADPNATITVVWKVPDSAAPTGDEADTKLWMYRSTLNPVESDNAGLIGPILVSRSGVDPSSLPGRDLITFMTIFDESLSPLYQENLGNRTASDFGMTDQELTESLWKHVINGYVFCNIPGLEMTAGESVRWHFAGLGSDVDMHTAHLHGNTWLFKGQRADQVLLISGSTRSVDLDARTPGTWLFHCHVNEHIHAGMMALYTVKNATTSTSQSIQEVPASSPVRRYYVAAEVVEWNYAPLGGDGCTAAMQEQQERPLQGPGTPTPTTPQQPTLPFSETALEFVGNGTGLAGSVYYKALYIEYTDDTFSTKKQRSPEDAYLGLLGPIMRAEVGETIEVVFLNRLNYSVSMHPHGVAYNKSSEGAHYYDGTPPSDKIDDAVPPNTTYTYVWTVPPTAGPGPKDPSTIGWLYHSHSNEVSDPYAGLIGAIIIGRPGAFSNSTSTPTARDVDVEAVVLFAILNERQSLLWPSNVAAIVARDGPAATPLLTPPSTPSAEGAMVESEMMHSINGYVYCNGPALSVPRNGILRLHVISIGTEVDLHSPTLSGATLESSGQRTAALAMLPGVMTTAEVRVEMAPGWALMQCRVADHIAAGMQTLVDVIEEDLATSMIKGQGSGSGGSGNIPNDTTTAAAAAAVVRPYYIAAEESLWDYAPLGQNNCPLHGPVPLTSDEAMYVTKYVDTIGSSYTKALYRRYTDATFTRRLPVPQHQGLLGPVIAGEVGDVLEITFNNSLGFEVNLHFDGGFVPLNDSADPAAPVPPGQVVVYRIYIPEAAGPGPQDVSTVAYAYTSSVDYVSHPMAGLVGVVMVGGVGVYGGGANASLMPPVPVPQGVEGVIPLLAAIFDENESPYLERNAAGVAVSGGGSEGGGAAEAAAAGEAAASGRRLLESPSSSSEGGSASPSPADATTTSADNAAFYLGNIKHSINGFMFCNGPELTATAGATYRVVVLTVGSESDVHTIQFAGQSLVGSPAGYSRAAVEPLLPAVALSSDLTPNEPGRWSVDCEIHDHYIAGMHAMLRVSENGTDVTSGGRRSTTSVVGMGVAAVVTILAIFSF